MLSKIEALSCILAIALLALNKLETALPLVAASLAMHAKRSKGEKPRDEILELAERGYRKSGSALLTLGKLTKYKKLGRAFKAYWTDAGEGGEENSLEERVGNALLRGASTGEGVDRSIELLKEEEKVNRYKQYALGKANGMIALSRIGLSFFFPFFAGIGVSIVKEGLLIGSHANLHGVFSIIVFAYIAEALIVGKAFYSLDKSIANIIQSSLLPISIAMLVFRLASLIYAFL
ncbi:MAG: hypothetical protein ACP5HW_02955 [Candidatus Micrarchaeia archaeon]|jgi:hypothetical protein